MSTALQQGPYTNVAILTQLEQGEAVAAAARLEDYLHQSERFIIAAYARIYPS